MNLSLTVSLATAENDQIGECEEALIVTYRVAEKHDCVPMGCAGCGVNASAACRCHGVQGSPAAADSPGKGRNGRSWPCTDPRGSGGPRVDSLATSTAPTCNWPRPDPDPCGKPRARLSSQSSPEGKEARRHTISSSLSRVFTQRDFCRDMYVNTCVRALYVMRLCRYRRRD